MRPHFSGFSWRYSVEEKWEQLGGEAASSTLGWRERDRDRSVLSEHESAVISLSPCFSSDSRPPILPPPIFCHLNVFLCLDFFTSPPSSPCTDLVFAKAEKDKSVTAKIGFKGPENLFVFEGWGWQEHDDFKRLLHLCFCLCSSHWGKGDAT